MKKLLTLTAVGAMLTVPANAVQKCVTLDSSVDGTNITYTSYASNWSVQFPDITVSGVGVCGNTGGASSADTLQNLTYSGTFANNRFCWCRMISPVASSYWWYSIDAGSGANCLLICSNNCASGIKSRANIRNQVFGSLAN